MTRRLLALACLLGLAVACRKGSARLEGHWVGQKASGSSGDVAAAANKFATEMTLDFHGDTLVVKTERQKQTGHYRVLREDEQTVVLVTDEDAPGDAQTFTLPGDGTLVWSVLQDKTIVFKKQ
jgi:hypothetical protein